MDWESSRFLALFGKKESRLSLEFGFRNRRKSTSRKDAKRAKFKIKKFTGLKQIHFLLSDLCALAPLREIIRLSVAARAQSTPSSEK